MSMLNTFTYDPLSQLTLVQAPSGKAGYTYDPVGNRLRSDQATGPTPYTPNALNQYTQVGSSTLRYDANGNLTSDGTTTFAYDSEHRLLRAESPTHRSQYTYDPFGRRLSKTVNGQTTTFLYDGDQLIGELKKNALTASYVYGPGIDEPLRMTKGRDHFYYHPDGLGSIAALTDATGAVVERYEYDAFGTPQLIWPTPASLTQLSSVGNRFFFTGREYDQETGLYHYRARTYSPKLGRFLQRDPLGYLPDVNLYRYVGSVGKPLPYFKSINETNAYLYAGNNPITRIDPLGLWYIDVNVGGGWWGALATGGVIFSDKGIYYYVGGGGGTSGPAAAVTWSPFDPTPGWNFGLQAGGAYGIFGGQGGADIHGNLFLEAGLVSPGFAVTAFYVQPIWEAPQPQKKGCQP